MKHIRYCLGFALLLAGSLPAFSQVSNDNEDEVYKIDSRFPKNDFVPGQVLVKFKDQNRVTIRRAKGKFLSADRNSVNEVLQKYGTEEMEQLLPHEKPGRTLRKAKAYNGTIVEEKDLSQLYCVKLSEEHQQETMQLVDELKALDEVEFAEPNYRLYTLAEEEGICVDYDNNSLVSQQWYLEYYGVKELWNKPIINSERPVIAILDTGVDITHPDLVDNIWTNAREADGENGYDNDNNGFKNDLHGWDFINNTSVIRDYNSHGTHVAGIAAASNNGIGIIGANPMAYIMPITVMQSDGTGDVATIVKGINYAVSNGATVLNLSLGSYAYSSALRQALANAYQLAVIVAAAGNNGRGIEKACDINGAPLFPAAYSFVLGVQAITQQGRIANFSNYDCNGPNFSNTSSYRDPDGFNYELKAPGVGILSAIPNGNYKEHNGTSMAAPLVAGAISALKMVKEYDTQEILWGDLTHTDNIAQAYSLTERPAELDIIRLMLRDRKELTDETELDYSDDGRIDAGETVSIYPVIRTTWGEASNIKLRLEMGDEFEDPNTVEIITPEADFDVHLDAYSKGVSVNPLRLKVADDVADKRYIKMKIVATCDGTATEWERNFVLIVDNVVKINGLISENTTLSGDRTYYVDNNILVSGCTLEIEPGARLEFAEGKTLKISSDAHLLARGEPEKMIVFTSRNYSESSNAFTIDVPYRNNTTYWTNEEQSTLSYNQSSETPIKYKGTIYAPSLDNVGNFCSDVSLYTLNKIAPCTSISYTYLPKDTIEYCVFENGRCTKGVYLKDCIVHFFSEGGNIYGERVNIHNIDADIATEDGGYICNVYNSNIVNVFLTIHSYKKGNVLARYLRDNNYFNIHGTWVLDSRTGGSSTPQPEGAIIKMYRPSYFGTTREDLIRPYVREFGNCDGVYTTLDLSNMRTEPVAEAHGIVWKVVVDGYDAQDEFEQLPPLGVGRHKFDVYFNRPMNKEVMPQISFGVREPYTQQVVAEDGSWNEEGTIYTAYKTITGKTKSDGLNRIYVYGAEDNEFFEIPYEKTRFNINIQAAGSMAIGFAAEAGLGKVDLMWNNENNDIEDAMGYNLYRYTITGDGENLVADTIRVNESIIDIEDETYTDYDVTPGQTYYYFYRTLSTDLQEYDVSNVVAVTPLTSTKGDANGSGEVDVADVITTVNYASGQQPKPFIFEAADMNDDLSIDILDVIGIIKDIMHLNTEAKASVAAVATYTIEDGIVYVDSPVEIAGVQVQLATSSQNDIRVVDDMKGFEHTSAWLSDNDYLFLGYNMNGKTLTAGKHAILIIGDAQISDIRLSDAYGHNIMAESPTVDKIDRMARDVMTVKGVYDLQGRKLFGKESDLQRLPKGVYIVNGQKVVR